MGGRAVLGNHEIKSLLSVAGIEPERPAGLTQVLRVPDAEELLEVLTQLDSELEGPLEAVFVVDGSPDGSHRVLRERIPDLE